MTRLRACYFCGTTEALTEYETLPEQVRTGPDDTQTVVLCDRCHSKLRSIVSPIVGRFTARDPASAADDSTSPRDESVVDLQAEDADDAAQTGITFDVDEDSTNDEVSSAAEDVGDAAISFEGPGSDHSTSTVSENDESIADPDSQLQESPETDDSDTDIETEDEESAETSETDDGETDDGETETESPENGADVDAEPSADDASTADAEQTAVDDESGATDDDRGLSAMDYYKLLRFLRNRELPMPRERAEALVSGAYDLRERDAAELIDLAIERDELFQEDGQLFRS